MINSLFATTLAQMYSCSLENDLEQYRLLKEHLDDLNLVSLDIESELLRQAVLCASIENFKLRMVAPNTNKSTNEYSLVHTWVRRNMANILGLDIIDKFPSLESGRRPDFLVLDNGVRYPVECKKVFNRKSLNQLEQYMVEMDVDRGYAVAPKLTIDLPENIIFIQSEGA